MNTETGEIGNLKDLVRKALHPESVVELGNPPVPGCPWCFGSGRLVSDEDPTRFKPCPCTNPIEETP